jgi:glycosyltransferase involved in cell wall biosynthesis
MTPLAIVAAHNEADIIVETMHDLLEQGCAIHVVDNWSTDETFELADAVRQQAPDRVAIERFPASGPTSECSWSDILNQKADIAARHPNRWILHADADEIRRPHAPYQSLVSALSDVGHQLYNRVNFRVLDFRPIDDEPFISMQTLRWFEFGKRPGQLIQWKAWRQPDERVDLATSGGHEARFSQQRDYPFNFILKHYPLRSFEQRVRKLQERRERWSSAERRIGWHTHYDDIVGVPRFSRDALVKWDDSLHLVPTPANPSS